MFEVAERIESLKKIQVEDLVPGFDINRWGVIEYLIYARYKDECFIFIISLNLLYIPLRMMPFCLLFLT